MNKRSTYIAGARRLAQSLDVQVTLRAIAELSLPDLGAWCIVDLLNADAQCAGCPSSIRGPARYALVTGLEERWLPRRGDQFGRFEPFVHVSSGLTTRGAGVGLGLAISRELARAMNGDLSVESTLGAGSRFTLALPRGRDAHRRGR